MKRSGKKKSIWFWILASLSVLLICVLIYGLLIYKGLTNTANDIYEPIERDLSDKRKEAVTFKNQEPFSVLVLGVDETELDTGRSDTMIIMTVNPKSKSTKMVSIPRDTLTDIAGRKNKDKINHAYAFGGIQMAMETVEDLFDIPIDYVVQVNMESFKDIVDAVGGIKINNTFNFTVGDYTFTKGDVQLDGTEALAYVRMRYEDPRGDFGRQDRQKQVVQAVLRKGASVSSLLNYNSIFGAIGDNVRTNMTFDEMVDIQSNYRDAVGKIEQLYINEGQGKKMNGIWYYIMDEAELKEIQNTLKAHLEM